MVKIPTQLQQRRPQKALTQAQIKASRRPVVQELRPISSDVVPTQEAIKQKEAGWTSEQVGSLAQSSPAVQKLVLENIQRVARGQNINWYMNGVWRKDAHEAYKQFQEEFPEAGRAVRAGEIARGTARARGFGSVAEMESISGFGDFGIPERKKDPGWNVTSTSPSQYDQPGGDLRIFGGEKIYYKKLLGYDTQGRPVYTKPTIDPIKPLGYDTTGKPVYTSEKLPPPIIPKRVKQPLPPGSSIDVYKSGGFKDISEERIRYGEATKETLYNIGRDIKSRFSSPTSRKSDEEDYTEWFSPFKRAGKTKKEKIEELKDQPTGFIRRGTIQDDKSSFYSIGELADTDKPISVKYGEVGKYIEMGEIGFSVLAQDLMKDIERKLVPKYQKMVDNQQITPEEARDKYNQEAEQQFNERYNRKANLLAQGLAEQKRLKKRTGSAVSSIAPLALELTAMAINPIAGSVGLGAYWAGKGQDKDIKIAPFKGGEEPIMPPLYGSYLASEETKRGGVFFSLAPLGLFGKTGYKALEKDIVKGEIQELSQQPMTFKGLKIKGDKTDIDLIIGTQRLGQLKTEVNVVGVTKKVGDKLFFVPEAKGKAVTTGKLSWNILGGAKPSRVMAVEEFGLQEIGLNIGGEEGKIIEKLSITPKGVKGVEVTYTDLSKIPERDIIIKTQKQFQDIRTSVLKKTGVPEVEPYFITKKVARKLSILEPQVSSAIKALNKKGYETISSGFYGKREGVGSQVIEILDSLDEITISKLKKIGIKVEGDLGRTSLIIEQEGKSLTQIKNIFNKGAEILPQKQIETKGMVSFGLGKLTPKQRVGFIWQTPDAGRYVRFPSSKLRIQEAGIKKEAKRISKQIKKTYEVGGEEEFAFFGGESKKLLKDYYLIRSGEISRGAIEYDSISGVKAAVDLQKVDTGIIKVIPKDKARGLSFFEMIGKEPTIKAKLLPPKTLTSEALSLPTKLIEKAAQKPVQTMGKLLKKPSQVEAGLIVRPAIKEGVDLGTLSVTAIDTKDLAKERLKEEVVTKLKGVSITKEKEVEAFAPGILSSNLLSLGAGTKLREGLTFAQPLALRTKQIQTQVQVQKQSGISGFRDVSDLNFSFPGEIGFIPPGLGRREKPKSEKVQAYYGQVKRKSKWKTISPKATKQAAVDYASEVADKTLAASFRIVKAKKKIKGKEKFIQVEKNKLAQPTGYWDVNKYKFRRWKSHKKVKTKLPRGGIELEKFRLDSPGEKKKIQRARGVRGFFGF